MFRFYIDIKSEELKGVVSINNAKEIVTKVQEIYPSAVCGGVEFIDPEEVDNEQFDPSGP